MADGGNARGIDETPTNAIEDAVDEEEMPVFFFRVSKMYCTGTGTELTSTETQQKHGSNQEDAATKYEDPWSIGVKDGPNGSSTEECQEQGEPEDPSYLKIESAIALLTRH